jgi:hypothetical protein
MTLEIEIPEGSSATLGGPGLADETRGSGSHERQVPSSEPAAQPVITRS